MENTKKTNSILTSIKKLLGMEAEYTHFDTDIVMHINSVFSILSQLGVGPDKGFSIQSDAETWDQFIGNNANDDQFSMVKSYMNLKVRLLFDPPLSSASIDSINRQISELEWRLSVAADPTQ